MTHKLNTDFSNAFDSRESASFWQKFFFRDVDLKEHALLLQSALEELQDAFLRQKKGTAAKITTQITAKIVAASATSSVLLGAAGIFGTASTGTAIGALSGAAYTSASLAWIGGSVASGAAIVGAVSLAAGIAVIPVVGIGWRRFISGKKRALNSLDERELQITLGIERILVALNAEEQTELGLLQAWKHMILPICERLQALEATEYKDWTWRDKRRLRQAIKKLNSLARTVDKRLSEKAVFAISAVGAFLFKVFSDVSKWSDTDHMVMQAIARSTNELADDSSTDQIVEYIQKYSLGPSRDGLIANIKGIYHELAYAKAENSDGDAWFVELSQKTNEPGIDAYLFNRSSGEGFPIQLKSTDSSGVVTQHFDTYPGVAVFGSSELASKDSRVSDSGFEHEDISDDVTASVNKLSDEGSLINELQGSATVATTSAFIAMSLTFGQALKSGEPLDRSAIQALNSTRRAVGFAALSTALGELLL